MKESTPQVRPEAAHRKQRIEAALERLTSGRAGRQDTLLFLGSCETPLPERVFEDAVLEPVDKTVWMVIALQAAAAGKPSPFPTYEQIGRKANIASRSTVARAVRVLRATRWLTRCNPPDETRCGPLFLLCDEPLSVAEVCRLDPGYLQFLQDTQDHHHARVRDVMKRELETWNAEMPVTSAAQPSVAYTHGGIKTPELFGQGVPDGSLESQAAPPAGTKGPGDPNQNSVRRPSSNQNSVHQNLVPVDNSTWNPSRQDARDQYLVRRPPSNQNSAHQNLVPVDNSTRNPALQDARDQNLVRRLPTNQISAHQYLVPVDNLARKPVPKTAISGHHEPENTNGIPGYGVRETRGTPRIPLVYPRRFSAIQRELAQHCLSTLEAAQRQTVLDELEGRIRAEKRGMSPIYDDLRFLNSLCKAMKNGNFRANLGVRVSEERIAREAVHKRQKRSSKPPPPGQDIQALRQRIAKGKGPLEAMRKALGQCRRRTRSSPSGEPDS